MDDKRFDRLAAALAAGPSRRGVLRLISGGGLLASLGGASAEVTAARKKGKRKKKKCRGNKKKCGRRCIPKTSCCTSSECPEGEVCRNGRCSNCASADDCPNPPVCEEAVCDDGRCTTARLPAGSHCSTNKFCIANETCNADGECGGGSPRDCDDGTGCSVDTCDEESNACTHTPNDALCVTTNPCRIGRCDPADDDSDDNGCIFDPIDLGTVTCGLGACTRTVPRCVDGEEQDCVPGQPSAEICNGIDDDCDGVVDDGACPVGQRCEGGGCCTVDGFGPGHACTSSTECCSGNCATHDFGTTCRPAGCLPSGGDCSAGPQACCSFTCTGTTCQ